MIDQDQESAKDRRSRGRARSGYLVRILSSLALVLLLLIGLTRLPIGTDQMQLGWMTRGGVESMTFNELKEPIELKNDRSEVASSSLLISAHSGASDNSPQLDSPHHLIGGSAEESGVTEDEEDKERLRPLTMAEMQLNMAEGDRIPRVEGGMGNLYLHIHYPEAARRAGIQGRMEMVFVVQGDGQVRDIEVSRELHPLTDSSAVRALRRVTFVPGRKDGKPVDVRMRLPVRFSLVHADGSPVETDSTQRYDATDASHVQDSN